MQAYRQWLNGVRRRAAVRWQWWREIERILAAAVAPRTARVAAALATATVLLVTIGLMARLSGSDAAAERGRQAATSMPGSVSSAPQSPAASAR